MPRASMVAKNEELEATPPVEDPSVVEEDEANDEDSPQEIEEALGIQVENLPPDEILWEGGPTAGQVVAWKNQYENVYITNVTFDKHIVWRALNRDEYKSIVRQIEGAVNGGMGTTEATMLNEELTCVTCFLLPHYKLEDFGRELAGLPSILAQQINESSGFATIDVRQL